MKYQERENLYSVRLQSLAVIMALATDAASAFWPVSSPIENLVNK